MRQLHICEYTCAHTCRIFATCYTINGTTLEILQQSEEAVLQAIKVWEKMRKKILDACFYLLD